MKVHKDDFVLVISGKDKGAKGKICRHRTATGYWSSTGSSTPRSRPPAGRAFSGIVAESADPCLQRRWWFDSDASHPGGYQVDGRPASASGNLQAQQGHLMTTAQKVQPRLKERTAVRFGMRCASSRLQQCPCRSRR